jgi:hypothetical protein
MAEASEKQQTVVLGRERVCDLGLMPPQYPAKRDNAIPESLS